MNTICKEFVEYITTSAPKYNKHNTETAVLQKYALTKDRKVYHNDSFAVRFSYSKSSSNSFSNTILSLSALEKYDKIPFFVVLIRKNAENLILLANSTLIKKISHSSQGLSMTNIKGSFNGSDILRDYNGITNTPNNFDYLFDIHAGLEWNDNLERLVDATSNIKPVSKKFIPTELQTINIYNSIQRADSFVKSKNFNVLEEELNIRCNKCKNEILIASHIENTNIRGRIIESLITSDDNERKRIIQDLKNIEKAYPSYDTKNGLGDFCMDFDNGSTYTDIKTKVVYLSSNPKAYNVDKFLRQMADSNSIFLFYFIGVDENSIFKTLLCSVYHKKMIDNTILQLHWAGRSTRGTAQFNGTAIDEMLREDDFQNNIDVEKCKEYISSLLDR